MKKLIRIGIVLIIVYFLYNVLFAGGSSELKGKKYVSNLMMEGIPIEFTLDFKSGKTVKLTAIDTVNKEKEVRYGKYRIKEDILIIEGLSSYEEYYQITQNMLVSQKQIYFLK